MPISTGSRCASVAAAIALLTATASAQSPSHSATEAGLNPAHSSNARIANVHADASGHGHSGHSDAEMSEMEGHDSGTVGEHSHGTLAILDGQPAPEVTLTVHDDALKGWNLEIEVENFTLAPEEVNQESNTIEGHAHLYVNGVKVTRLYGPWFYLESLPSGEHELRIELNANGHEVLTHNGETIAATAIVTVP